MLVVGEFSTGEMGNFQPALAAPSVSAAKGFSPVEELKL
jgi:hypothetical protein